MTTYERLYEKKTACHAIALRLHLDGKHDMGTIWHRKAVELNDIMRHMTLGEADNDYKHKSTKVRIVSAVVENKRKLKENACPN